MIMFSWWTFVFACRAFEMIKNRGQRSWSVGLSIADVTNSILTDKKKAHSVSTLAQVEASHVKASVFSPRSLCCASFTSNQQNMCFPSTLKLSLFLCFVSGLGWNRLRGFPQPSMHHGSKRFHSLGWSFPRFGGRLQTERHCLFPL